MLQLTPAALKMLRRQKRAKEEKKARKLARARRRALVEIVAAYMRTEHAEGRAPTKLTHESTMRHGIRSGLCLDGWGWAEADAVAIDVVQTALNQIGAVRPTWKQGQPEWTQDGHSPVERTRCIRCGWKLPEGHRMFCSPACAKSLHNEHYARDRRARLAAYARAWRAARRKEQWGA